MADGSIRIDTKIDNKGVKTGLNELTSSLKKTQTKIKDIFNSFSNNNVEEQFSNISQEASRSSKIIENELNKSSKSVDKLNEGLKNTQSELKNVENEMDGIAEEAVEQFSMFNEKISDADFDKLVQGQLDSNKEYQNLIQKQEELNNKAEEYQNKIQNAKNRITELKAELEESKRIEQEQTTVKGINNQVGQELNANKVLDGISTQEQYNRKLEETKNKLKEIEQLTSQIASQQANGNVAQANILKEKALETNNEYQRLQKQLQILQGAQGRFTQAVQKTTKAQKNSNATAKGIAKGINGGIKSLAKYALALLSIRSIYNILSRAANSWLNSTDSAAKQIKANFEYMSYAVGSAFKPILTWMQNTLYKILSIIASIVKTLTGVNIFANAGAKAYAKMADSAGNAAKSTKEMNNNLAKFDDLDVLQKNSDNNSGGGSGLETMPDIDLSNVNTFDIALDGIYEKIKAIWNLFKQGFDVSFGETNFDGILSHLGNIKEALIDIWTDPKVVNSASNWANTVIYTLGQVTGSVTRIGTNIVENLVGSIDKYLSQNSGRIKEFITNMFDISNKKMTLVGNFMQALGEISDVLKGDTAKQIGADIIAIFANPIMSVLEIISKFSYDLGSMLVQPIIDNADKIKVAIENTLNPIQKITGTISEALTYIGDKMNEVYDNYISPFMESLKTGLSDTFGKFLDVYNQYVAPFLSNMGTGFQTLWNEHLKPLVDKIGEFVGAIVEALQALWENWLKPLIDWIVQNVLPVLVPIFEAIWNTVSNVFGAIADVISGIIEAFTGLIDFIVGIFTGDWNKAWEGIKTFFSGIWNAIKGIVSAVWEAIKGIVDTAINIIKAIVTTVFNAIKSIITNIWNGIKSFFSNIWNAIVAEVTKNINNIKSIITNIFNTIKTFVTDIWNNISNTIKNVINGIKNTITSILNSIKSTWTNIWNGIKATVTNIWNSISTTISNVINNIKNTISNIINSIKSVWDNVWNGMKETITNVFNGIWNTIRGVINSILGGVEKMANGVINGINSMIRALNNLSFDVPDWVPGLGGKKFGFNIGTLGNVSLPRLAKGGIVNQPTRALIGEAGREAVLPLENNTEWMDLLAEKISTMLQGNVNGNSNEIVIKFDGTLAQLIRILKPELDKESIRKGNKLVIGGSS